MHAAACVSAAVYEAASAVWPATAMRKLRAEGLGALLRIRFRAAPEPLVCMLGLPWHADAMACVAIAPWDFLLRARDYGDITGPALERLLDCFIQGRPENRKRSNKNTDYCTDRSCWSYAQNMR